MKSKPIALAVAAAILICAIPLSYRILQCERFESGISLTQLFAFKCDGAVAGGTSQETGNTAGGDGSTGASLAGNDTAPFVPATQSTTLTGHVYYEETGGKAKGSDAAFLIAGTAAAPPYGELTQGTILKTVRSSSVRSAAGSGEPIVDNLPSGRCAKIMQRPDRPVHELKNASSAGWLLVQATPCP